MKTITIELSTESCKAALEQLKPYKKSDKKLDLVCKKLAEIARDEAQRRFDRGAEHGNGGVQVSIMPIENGYKVIAQGEDVYFIEFGTGIFANPNGYDTTVPVYPGSYSEQNAQKFSEYGYWWYGGEKLQGTEAQNAMYYAGRAIRENERRVWEEVFGK